MIDIGRAFKAPFEDREWVSKTLLGFVWAILVVTSPAIYGAQIEYIRSVHHGNETLPTWDDFGNKWVQGLLVSVAGLLYMLPVAILGVLFIVPGIIGAMASGGEGGDAVGALFAGGFCLFWVFALAWGIAVSVLFSAALTHYAMRGTFASFFEFREIMSHVRGGTGYFTAWAYLILISLAGSTVVSLLTATFVGGVLAPAITYLIAVMSGHVLGQWARAAYPVTTPVMTAHGAASGAPPAPPAPPV